ncbi:acetate--CoA ligase family protein [Roseibium polysiphoniae]|uniref:Acetate--CoA ligase family protein n=1 Tax=Roseibium polysiphoniae TaxID=2571221 RepID=A0ABR9CE97_9HYPH|nr:acetate--CoA ligase family protein [Roseibium polysiphoniae]MBD8878214.1 acetate--CoA ligase family protein [Roseibium polysiphoniae]
MAALERLLAPKSIAVIGGGIWCTNVIGQCRKSGYDGALWAVHPSKTEIGGCAAVRSLADLPEPPDAAFVGVNRHLTIDIVRELSAAGAGGAVCFASGFSEAAEELADGSDLQSELLIAAGHMPILGPNCYGFINALDGAALWPDQHGLVKVPRGVAIIAQSSNIALNLTMQARGLPIAYLVTVGNQAQVGLSNVGQALLDDPRVTAIGLHIEGIDDLAAFEAFALKAQACGKPIVALKIGRSAQAMAATISHTASLAGSMAGASALLKRTGVAQANSLPELLETLKIVHTVGRLSSAKVASMSCSGGEASLIADTATGSAVTFPALTGDQKSKLMDALGSKVALANPLDYHTYIWGDIDAMSRTFAAMMAGDVALGIVVLDIPRTDRCAPDEWLKVIDAIEKAMTISGKPMAILSTLAENMPEHVASDLIARNIVPLSGLDEAIAAISAVSKMGTSCRAPIHIPLPVRDPVLLSEHDAKETLKHHGLRLPKNTLAAGSFEAASVASDIGFPVVLKGNGIAHKTEANAVALNLQSPEGVETAAEKIPVDSFLVEEMVTHVLAELLVGVVLDPAHGLVLTLAAGGILTELLQDRVSLLLPVSREDVASALGRLKYARVLQGYRGSASCDLEAIVDAVMAVQSYALSGPVAEVEINPLLCGADFAIAADALIKCGAPQ